MINPLAFRKGDILIDFGKAYIVCEIKNQITQDGKTEPFVVYKPRSDDWLDRSLICSIPVSSLAESNIRRPLSKNQLTSLLKLIDEKPINDYQKINTRDIKVDEILQSNNPAEIIKLLIKLWIPKKDLTLKSAKNKKRTCVRAIEMLSQEIATVYNITEEKAEQLLLAKLD